MKIEEGAAMYEQVILAIFLNNWSEAIRTAERLQISLRRLKANFPLDGKELKDPSDDLIDGLDAFRVRYSDLQDCIGNKIFRGILLLEEETPASTLAVLNKMEKRKIIHTVDAWRKQREIRNAFAHDYPNKESDKAEALNAAWETAPAMIALLKSIVKYFKPHLILELGAL